MKKYEKVWALIVAILIVINTMFISSCGKDTQADNTESAESSDITTEDTKTEASSSITIDGIPLENFMVDCDFEFGSNALMLIKWLNQMTGITVKNSENKIKLVRDLTLPVLNSKITSSNGQVTIAVGECVSDIDPIIEKFKTIIDNRTTDNISFNEEIPAMSTLNNTYYKLTHDKKLNVAFIGGSVTDGYGSTDQKNKSWVAHTTNWLKEKFPDAEINSYKKSIGGTGSYFGVHRFEHDVAPCNPDLLFIEFAINDCYEKDSYEQVVMQSESIVRKAYAQNPNIDIVYVLTLDDVRKDTDYEQLRAHRDVADKYGLLSIKMGDYLFKMLDETGGEYKEYFTDGVHPNDKGYEFFASVIIKHLNGAFASMENDGEKFITPKLPQNTLSEKQLLLNADLICPKDYTIKENSGWYFSSSQGSTRYGGSYYTTKNGSKLTVEFEGTSLGFVCIKGPSKGNVTVSIDGGAAITIDANLSSNNIKGISVAQNLGEGKHTAVIEFVGDTGKTFELCAILVG